MHTLESVLFNTQQYSGLRLCPCTSVCYESTLQQHEIWKASNTRRYSKTSYLGIFAMTEILSWRLISTHGRLSANIWQRQQNLECLQRLNLALCLSYLACSLTDPMTCFTSSSSGSLEAAPRGGQEGIDLAPQYHLSCLKLLLKKLFSIV